MIENLFKKTLELADLRKTSWNTFRITGLAGGKGRCATCKVIITQGHERFAKALPQSAGTTSSNRFQNTSRCLSGEDIRRCMARAVPEEGQLAHVRYSPEE